MRIKGEAPKAFIPPVRPFLRTATESRTCQENAARERGREGATEGVLPRLLCAARVANRMVLRSWKY